MEKAKQAIANFHMLQKGDRVAAGVSGGADSVAMLHFLHCLAEEYELTLVVCHLNHRLRGAESDADAAFVRAMAARYNLAFCEDTFDAGAYAVALHTSVEDASRRYRYEFLAKAAGEKGKIATAHTLTDSLETTLFNLTRGTGLKGLAGIPPVRGNIIRPLITTTREEVEAYCRVHGLSWRTDSSNHTDVYARNRLRRHVTPVLRALNPALYGAFARMSAALRHDEDYLTAAAQSALTGLWDTNGEVRRASLLTLHPALQMRVLALLFRRAGAPVSARLLELALACARAGSGAVELSGGLYFMAASHTIAVAPQSPTPAATVFAGALPNLQSLSPGLHTWPIAATIPKTLEIRVILEDKRKTMQKISKSGFKNTLENSVDCDKINGSVVFRSRHPGDAISLQGRGGTKSLKKLFNEAHTPPAQRASAVILCDGTGPLWVEGFGVAARVAAGENTTRFLQLAVRQA